MSLENAKLFLRIVEIFFSFYLLGYATFLFVSVCIGASSIYKEMKLRKLKSKLGKTIEIPISILVPAYNEEITIYDSIISLLNLDYKEYEIIVIDDGSKDNTAQILIDNFNMVENKSYIKKFKSNDVLNVYVSNEYKVKISLICKKNGGKADALNKGIIYSNNPYFICMDADSLLQKDSLKKIIAPILEDNSTIAVGGMVRISNDIQFKDSYPVTSSLPKNTLVAMQVLEYDRTFLGSRIMFDKFNGNLIISGAFGLFRKDMVMSCGSYDKNNMGEDMELVIKLHAFSRSNMIPYKIKYAPEAICWSQAPENIKDLTSQRKRWYIGLIQTMLKYNHMFCNPRYGLLSFISYLYFLIYELLSPVIELFGIFIVIMSFMYGLLNVRFMVTLFLIYALFGSLISVTAFFTRIYLSNVKVSVKDAFKVLLLCFFEITFLRFYLSFVRFSAIFTFIFKKSTWGKIKRVKHNV